MGGDGICYAVIIDGARPFSQSRNQLIADALYKCKAIESYGTGLKRIKTLCADAGVEFEYESVPQGTIVRFFRPDWFEEGTAKKDRTSSQNKSASRADRMQEREAMALEIARTNGKVTTAALVDATGVGRRTAAATLKKLADSELLVWHGTSLSDPAQ